MGEYLSTPNKTKHSSEGANNIVSHRSLVVAASSTLAFPLANKGRGAAKQMSFVPIDWNFLMLL